MTDSAQMATSTGTWRFIPTPPNESVNAQRRSAWRAPSCIQIWGADRLVELFLELAHSQILLSAAPYQLVRLQLAELIELPDQSVVDVLGRCLVVGVSAADGLRDDLVDHMEIE